MRALGFRALWLAVLSVGLGACASSYRLDKTPPEYLPPQTVIRRAWGRTLVHQKLLSYKPQEWASAAIDARGTIYVGSSAGRFLCFDRHGRLLWQVKTHGGISSKPLLDEQRHVVYFGADDGKMYAVDTRTAKVRWSYTTQGTISHAPVYTNGILLFTSSENRIYGLDAQSGKWRWQYDRARPEGFTIHGYAGVLVHDGLAYTGFSDGTLVALKPATGEVVWTRSLAGDEERFVDVDATPVMLGGLLICASYASGVVAVAPDSGDVAWRAPLAAVSALAAYAPDRIFATAPRVGLVALDRTGKQLWRQSLPTGVPSPPVVADGRYVMVSSTESGLYVASLQTGDLLQHFAPGRGISSVAAVGAGMMVVLSNHGRLYTFALR